MRKEKLDKALYNCVSLYFKNCEKEFKGYIVRDSYHPNRYRILPIDLNEYSWAFSANSVKEYTILKYS